MKFSAFHAPTVLAAASVLLLAACGGGGGGTSTGPAPDRNATIKSANAKDVGAQTYAVVDFLNQQITNSAAEVTNPTNADLSASRCPQGGSASRTVGSNTVTLQYSNCDDGFQVIDGSAVIQLSNVQNDRFHDPAWSATLSITFNNLVFKLNKDLASLINIVSTETGNLTVAYTQTAPNQGSFQATSNSLQWRLTSGNSVIERNISLREYSGSIDASNLVKFNTKLTLSGPLGKLGTVSYDIATKTEFLRQYAGSTGYKNPSQGAMIVTAADKSSLTLTALDTTSAKLEVDWNGDNAVDDNISTTWSELNSLLLYQF